MTLDELLKELDAWKRLGGAAAVEPKNLELLAKVMGQITRLQIEVWRAQDDPRTKKWAEDLAAVLDRWEKVLADAATAPRTK